MDKNKIYITAAILFILIIAGFMLFDFLNNNEDSGNVYEYSLEKFTKVDNDLVSYNEANTFDTKQSKSRGIAIDENDNIYVSGTDKITVFNEDGKFIREIPVKYDPGFMTILNNKIYFESENKIVEYNLSNNTTKEIAELENNSIITSIAITDSTIFIADAGTKLVYGLSFNGEKRIEIGKKDSLSNHKGFIIPSGYFDLAIGRNNELWIVNPGRHQLESYTSDGRFISSWASTSMELEGFSGCCNPSHITILENGSFVTSEKGIVRVKIIDPTGKFKTVVATPDDFDKGTVGLDIAIDSEERIIILDPKRNQVRIFEEK